MAKPDCPHCPPPTDRRNFLAKAAAIVIGGLTALAAPLADYPREKFVDILRKTWRKMSPAALALALPPAIAVIAAIVRDAVTTP